MKYSDWNSVTEYLVKNLEKKVTEGNYKTGDRFMTELEICQEYNVGRSSVREALRALAVTGYIKIIRGRGAFVENTNAYANEGLMKGWYLKNPGKLDDINEVRMLIEPPAIAKATEVITEEQIENLKCIFKDMQVAVDSHDVFSISILDEKFHVALVDVVGNQYLSMVNMGIQKEISEFRARSYRIDSIFPLSHEQHRSIIECMEKHDSEAAEKEVRQHILSIQEYYHEAVRKE